MDSRRKFKENRVSVSGGMFNTVRTLSILTLDKAPLRPTLAAEISRSDAPFTNPEDMERYNLYLKTPLLRRRPFPTPQPFRRAPQQPESG